MDVAQPQTYSITSGGLLSAVERALRIKRGDRYDVVRRMGIAVALGYAPFLGVLAATGHLWSDEPAMDELLTHVRVLIAIPLLIAAEATLESRAQEVGAYLEHSSLVGTERVDAHRALILATSRLRDSRVPEIVMLLAVLGAGLELPSFTREPVVVVRWSMLPALLLYRFLVVRLLWWWWLWALYLRRLSSLPLALSAGHPDRVAGLEPLAGPSVAMGGVVMACGCVLSAGFADRMRFDGATAKTFLVEAIAYVVVAFVIALAPLLTFTGTLVRIRRHGVAAYGALAKHFVDAFEARWLERRGDELLEMNVVQSLNDLGGTVERVHAMRVIVAPRMLIQTVLVLAVAPLLPLVVAEIGAATLLERLAKALL